MNLSKKATVDLFSVNPKCITLGQLYGEIDETTMEWSDGLLAAAIRIFSKQSNLVYKEVIPGTSAQEGTSRPSSRLSKASIDQDLESLGLCINIPYLDIMGLGLGYNGVNLI